MPVLSLFRSAALALLATLGGTAAASAADVKATATYGVTLGGTNIANVTITLADTGKRYAMGLSARITGMAQLVANGMAKVDSEGQSTGSALVSEKFDLLIRASGEDFTVDAAFAHKDVTQFIVSPPILNNIDRVALERKHLRGVNDMMAAFVLKGGRLDQGLCKRRLPVFTGTERFNLTMSFAKADTATSKRTGYQGPLILCNVSYQPISGHYTTSETTNYLKESGRILIWYAPLGSSRDTFIPYRALISTNVGDLSIVLTELDQ